MPLSVIMDSYWPQPISLRRLRIQRLDSSEIEKGYWTACQFLIQSPPTWYSIIFEA